MGLGLIILTILNILLGLFSIALAISPLWCYFIIPVFLLCVGILIKELGVRKKVPKDFFRKK